MASKKFDNVDRMSGKKITALRREARQRADLQEKLLAELDLWYQKWTMLCGDCGYPIGECECD